MIECREQRQYTNSNVVNDMFNNPRCKKSQAEENSN